ncbi:septal ring lytic transglycosylase RlpA family protein [Kaistia sp. 32K]|uniref:septal ring lytic transglycosylase RlpA family protein n=1 Tax=Kaistia sp. 32K TaxID=2795690 RepID=UPI001FCFAAD8|nr:septal ring lytic transglycosylase RlpA family protein [Kaistia sp. 32K]
MLILLSLAVTALPILSVLSSPALPAPRHCGRASWYGRESGGRTASGGAFRPGGLSIAMRSRDFGRRYRVSLDGRSILVVHNDFGPAAWTGRDFDLSRGAAAELRMLGRGVATICVDPIS